MDMNNVGTKDHYFRTLFYMTNLIGKMKEKCPHCADDLKELDLGLQIINNEYVLKKVDFDEPKKNSILNYPPGVRSVEKQKDAEFQKKKEAVLAKIRGVEDGFPNKFTPDRDQ